MLKKWKKEKNGKYISYIKVLTKEIMLTKTINNYNNKKNHTPSQMNLSMLASITKREKEESRLVLNINTISVFFSPTNFI